MQRYSAKLLFQFRVVTDGESNKRRTCEERIVVLQARSAASALKKAKETGRKAQHRYKNDNGGTVHFEFVGVTDLQHLGPECEPNEVWYGIRELLTPMERKESLVPPESKLSAFVYEQRAQQGAQPDAGKRCASPSGGSGAG